ncbi:pilus assembly protein [Streptacidiphilus sp. 4-A2]|nr:pilus assembly protein [Streptacidiphilus sp. 4-A2]
MRQGRVGAERGSVAIEAAILVPVFIVLVGLIVAAGRVRTADGVVAEATRDAARAASMTQGDPVTAGQQAAQATLGGQGFNCPPAQIISHPGGGAGQEGTVTATINCQVPLADLLVRGLPGSAPVKYSFTAVIDTYRSQ